MSLPTPPAPGSQTLLVVLHGLVTLVDDGRKLTGFLIRMDGEHKYRAGSWLAERSLPAGLDATLSGVREEARTKDNRLNPVENPTVRLKSIPTGDGMTHARVDLGRPRRISYYARGSIKMATGAECLMAEPKHISGIRVLEYDVPGGFDNVSLAGDGFEWRPQSVTTYANGASVATLHIHNEPDTAVPPTHNMAEFAASGRLMGVEMSIANAVEEDVPDGELPRGVPGMEMAGLADRESVAGALIDLLRMGKLAVAAAQEGGCRPCCAGGDGDGDGGGS